MREIQRLAVFCGSSPGASPIYVQAARRLGAMLAEEGITLVYGGGNVGIMGAIADAVIEGGGEVIGIIPHGLVVKEAAHHGLSELRVVDSMHERKAAMAQEADGFVALPGGMGTLEEIFEIITWLQLGIHYKPCALLNVGGYYDRLVEFLDFTVEQQFVKPEHRGAILVTDDLDGLLDRLRSHEFVRSAKWIGLSES